MSVTSLIAVGTTILVALLTMVGRDHAWFTITRES